MYSCRWGVKRYNPGENRIVEIKRRRRKQKKRAHTHATHSTQFPCKIKVRWTRIKTKRESRLLMLSNWHDSLKMLINMWYKGHLNSAAATAACALTFFGLQPFWKWFPFRTATWNWEFEHFYGLIQLDSFQSLKQLAQIIITIPREMACICAGLPSLCHSF